jgi:hypothetical protein
MKESLDGSLPKMCPAVRPSDQDGCTAEQEKIFFKYHPPFSIFSLAAISVGSWDHWT